MFRSILLSGALLVFGAAPTRALVAPSGFVVENATPATTWNTPTAMRFFPSGRMLVAEKRGMVWTVTNGVRAATPLLDLRNEVLDNNDRGMLGLAIDPQYPVNRRIYLMYEVDPDSNGTDNNDDVFGRIVRYQISATDSNAVVPGSRTVLLGVDWRHGMLSASTSHGIGTLCFGADGSLFAGAGDGAQINTPDKGGQDPNAFGAARTDPAEDIGAFRSQMLESLDGKILRLNPATGQGYANNPYYDGNLGSNRSRVWCYGLRNPFRFTVRPGTGSTDPAAGRPGTLFIGDVGWETWDEQDVARTGGLNFGWPCIEGPAANAAYQSLVPAHNGCSSIGTAANPASPTAPPVWWHHTVASLSNPPGAPGNCAIGGVFYGGSLYPAGYKGRYFFADFGADWIKEALVDTSDQIVNVYDFSDSAGGPVCFDVHPQTGDVYYVSINTGQLRRIRYAGGTGNSPPLAIATASPHVGVAPLAVSFGSLASNDPDGDALTPSWDFGDGSGSPLASPSYTYTAGGTYRAVLTEDDGRGGVSRDTVTIFVSSTSAFPTTGVLDDFNRTDGALAGAWTGTTAGVTVAANRLSPGAGWSSIVLSTPVFGPTQEAFVTIPVFSSAASEHNLMLKVQGASPDQGQIEVNFNRPLQYATVNTFSPVEGWVPRGGPVPVTLHAGDRIGGRAYGDGTVVVYVNGAAILTADCSAWPFAARGGSIGLSWGDASASRFDDFGGGDAVLNPNTRPHATIASPADSSTFFTGGVIPFAGAGTDAQDVPGSLVPRWEVDLHHNNHVHPNTAVADSTALSLIGENHDDGTGVWLVARFIVTDTGGLRDTALVRVFPEVDLRPSAIRAQPHTPGTTAPALWSFGLQNVARMPSPPAHWHLLVDGVTVAQGDTVVPALDSVRVARWLPASFTAGAHFARVVVDSLHAIVETSRADNTLADTITVVPGTGPDEFPPLFLAGPTVAPSGYQAFVHWQTDEPSTGVLRWGATPALGESLVVATAGTVHDATITGLALGARVHYAVLAVDTLANAIASAVDSFDTQTGPLAVPAPPASLALSAAVPNPAAGTVSFTLALPAESDVAFEVFDLLGRAVWRDPVGHLGAGIHRLAWPGTNADGLVAAPAVYLVRVRAGGHSFERRMVRIR